MKGTLIGIIFIAVIFLLGRYSRKGFTTKAYAQVRSQAISDVYNSDEMRSQAEILDVCFSPNGDCAKHIVNQIKKAHYSIKVLAYAFNNHYIARELIKAHNRGIDVEIIADASQLERNGSDIPAIANAGVKCYKAYQYHQGVLHDKVIIIDDSVVITGSFNYTFSAEKNNAENVIILNAPLVAKKYDQHFNWIMQHGN